MDKDEFFNYQLEKRFAAQRDELVERIDALTMAQTQRSDALLQDLSDARVDLKSAREALAADFERSKREAAEVAVNRTLAVFTEAKNVLQLGATVLLAVAFGAGYLAYSSLQSTTTKFVESKVKDWLSISSQDSPVKTALEDLRTHALLDAWTVKLARQVAEGRRSSEVSGLAPAELERIRQIILDPTTSRRDFYDAARLIAASRGVFPGLSFDPDLASAAQKIFAEKAYDDQRRDDLLMVWWKDASLLPLTKAMLENSSVKYNDSWLLMAFKNLSNCSRKDGMKFAPGLLSSQNDELQKQASSFLASEDPLNPDLQRWIKDLEAKKSKHIEITLALLASQAATYVKTEQNERALNEVADWLVTALQQGAQLRLSQFGAEEYLVWQTQTKGATYFVAVEDSQTYLQTDNLLTEVLRKSGTAMPRLTTAVDALEVPDGDGMLASIEMTMGKNTKLLFEHPTRNLVAEEVVGPVRIYVKHDGESIDLMASWRQQNGSFQSAKILDATVMDASFSYAFEKDKVDAMDMRRVEQYIQ